MQIVKHDQSILGDNRDVKPESLLESNISEESRNINYVNLPQRQSFEVISSNGIPSGDGFTSSSSSHSTTLPVIVQSAVTAAQMSPADISYVSDSASTTAGDNKNDLLSQINDEQLFVENAGSFGQRLGVDIRRQNISPHSIKKSSPQKETIARNHYQKPMIKKNRKIHGVHLYNVGFSGHMDLNHEEPHFNTLPSTTLSPIMTTAIDQYSSLLPAFSNAIETSQKTVYSSSTENPRHRESNIGLSNPQQINYALLSTEMNQFKTFGLNKNSTFHDKISKTHDGFSKPIVVAEVTHHKPFEYSTTFECEDNITSSTPMPPILRASEIIPNKPYDTISSIVLNPIQAGVSLVNAGKEHFISRTTNNNLPIVEKKVDLNEEEIKENPKENDGIEIQKSIEIYHNAPIQEIHYPPQMFSQVIHIDNSVPKYSENLQNSKQRFDITTNTPPYENNDDTTNIYPDDKSHIYLINENAAAPIFQSIGRPRYYHIYPKLQESRDLKASIESKDHLDSPMLNTIRIGTESQVDEPAFQSYRSHDNKPSSSSSDINHGQQQIAVPRLQSESKTEISDTNFQDKNKPISHYYQRQSSKIIKLPQPFTIEKIIEKHITGEKKLLPYPIEMEKIVERKIPLEVTKYLEKPVPIHVPYGVQYGVSYQQIMKPQNHNLYSTQTATSLPLYGLSIIKNQVYNLTQPYQTLFYQKPFIGFLEQKTPYFITKNMNTGKKQFISHFTFAAQPSLIQQSSYSGYNNNNNNPSHRRRHTLQRLTTKEKGEMDGYIGPVPMQPHGFQSKASNFHSTIATRSPSSITTLRKVKQELYHHPIGKGSFRQSKMEYGFKPPMIPSVQYDEETASKVES